MKKIFWWLYASSVFATVNQPLSVEYFSNYRNDRIHWHLQDPGSLATLLHTELYRDVEFWENGLTFQAIHRDLSFFIRGSYGTFGRGTLFQKDPNPSFSSISSTDGWSADAVGYFGYAVNLTAGRVYQVILTPLIGYGGYFEQLSRKGVTAPGKFRLVWNGFFFGGTLFFNQGGPLSLQAGYSYHLMNANLHTQYQNSSLLVDSIRMKASGNGGQSGWVQMDWKCGKNWKIGLNGLIHYFTTRVVDANNSQAGRGDLSQKLKLRETTLSAGGQITRQF